ncbi:hypothetical protein [Amycolatopsis thermoflava]|uniref:hypothetical protein n=1 Tax=Amycolatopsis thermoflava TaxID=84480 RepID=UPI003D73B810
MLAHLDPTARVVVVLVGLLAVYVLSGFIWPYTACPTCDGGKHRSPTGKNWRSCGKCGGSGKKVRLISRILGRGD